MDLEHSQGVRFLFLLAIGYMALGNTQLLLNLASRIVGATEWISVFPQNSYVEIECPMRWY